MKKILALALAVMTVVLTGCSSAAVYVFTAPWIDKVTGAAYEKAVYKVERVFYVGGEESAPVTVAVGTLVQTISTQDGNADNGIITSELTMTYESEDILGTLPDYARKSTGTALIAYAVDTINSEHVFSDKTSVLRPVSTKKTFGIASSASTLSREITAEYGEKFKVTQTILPDGAVSKVEAGAGKVANKFDNEALYLLPRYIDNFKSGAAAVTLPIVSVTDTAINGGLSLYSLSISAGTTNVEFPFKIDSDFYKKFNKQFNEPEDRDPYIEAIEAAITNTSTPSGPGISVYFGAFPLKDPDNNSSEVLKPLLKIVQTENIIGGENQGKLMFRTIYTIKDLSTKA
ncbi:MAG: hypothetical protein LBS99_02930 [Clostridiales bacterium]|jgi:hypothetical protein|nr:hypothetical protein [Clostridiales bacterium]